MLTVRKPRTEAEGFVPCACEMVDLLDLQDSAPQTPQTPPQDPPHPLQRHLLEHPEAACYICELPDIVGKFDAARAKALGIPKGPLYGDLQRGKAVQLPGGKTVLPSEVSLRAELFCRVQLPGGRTVLPCEVSLRADPFCRVRRACKAGTVKAQGIANLEILQAMQASRAGMLRGRVQLWACTLHVMLGWLEITSSQEAELFCRVR